MKQQSRRSVIVRDFLLLFQQSTSLRTHSPRRMNIVLVSLRTFRYETTLPSFSLSVKVDRVVGALDSGVDTAMKYSNDTKETVVSTAAAVR